VRAISGKVVHFEIPADDLPRAESFYRDVFGWEVRSVPGMGYTLVTTTPTTESGPSEPGAINGGMLARQAPISAPVITIAVDDIDRALTRIAQLGGRTVRERLPVGGMGFAAYFADTEGNVPGATGRGADGTARPGPCARRRPG
jgi:predicted enzyme related to lactoylglutathione lyase